MQPKSQQISEYVGAKFHEIWNHMWFKLGATTAIAVPTTFMGVESRLFFVMLGLFTIDFLTGLIRAVKTKSFRSERMKDSITKLVLYFLLIATSWLMTFFVSGYVEFHGYIMGLLLVNEAVSVLENMAEADIGGNIPVVKEVLTFLKKYLDSTTKK